MLNKCLTWMDKQLFVGKSYISYCETRNMVYGDFVEWPSVSTQYETWKLMEYKIISDSPVHLAKSPLCELVLGFLSVEGPYPPVGTVWFLFLVLVLYCGMQKIRMTGSNSPHAWWDHGLMFSTITVLTTGPITPLVQWSLSTAHVFTIISPSPYPMF